MSDISEVLEQTDLQELTGAILSGRVPLGPRYAEIHLTNRCNSNCYFCNQLYLRSQNNGFDLSVLKQLISDLRDSGLRAVRLSGGGEPTVYPFLEDLLDFLHDSRITIARLNTNGIRLTAELSRLLINCGLKTLQISLQAPTRESWSTVTGLDAREFDRVISNIREFIAIDRNRSVKVHASFIVDVPTFDKIGTMVELCEDLAVGVAIHGLNNHEYSEFFRTHCLPEFRAQVQSHFRGRDFAASFLQSFLSGYCGLGLHTTNQYPACYAPWTAILVRPDGDAYPCCALAVQRFLMGNINSESIGDIWNGVNYSRLRETFRAAFFERSRKRDPELPSFCIEGVCSVKTSMFSIPQLDDMLGRQDGPEI